MRRRVHIDPRLHPRIRKDEPDRVVDHARLQFVGGEHQRCHRHPRGIGAGALIPPSGRRVDTVEVPDRETSAVEDVVRDVGAPHLVELVRRRILDDEVAVPVVHAAVPRLSLDRAAGWNRDRGHVAVRCVEIARRDERSVRRARVGGQDDDREVDLEAAVAEPARGREVGDDRARLRIDGGVRDVPLPERLRRDAIEEHVARRRRIAPRRSARRSEGVSRGRFRSTAPGAVDRVRRRGAGGPAERHGARRRPAIDTERQAVLDLGRGGNRGGQQRREDEGSQR